MGASCVGAVGIRAERGVQDRHGRAGDLGPRRVDVGVGHCVFDPVLEVDVDTVGGEVESRAPDTAGAGCFCYRCCLGVRGLFDDV